MTKIVVVNAAWQRWTITVKPTTTEYATGKKL